MAATKKAMDFTNVKDRGAFNPLRVTAGDYRATIEKVDDHLKDGEKVSVQWVYTIKLKGKRGVYPYYVNHTDPKHAWKMRNLLIAAGKAVPKKKVNVDPNTVVGREIGVSMDDDEYEGKPKSVIVATFPTSDLAEDAPSNTDTDDDEDGTEDDSDEVDDLDLEDV